MLTGRGVLQRQSNGGEPAGAREAGGCDGAMGWILPRQICILVGSGRYVSAVKGGI